MRAVIIGAGLGGLATALRLQGAGWEVTVLEGQAGPGGRASQITAEGFTFDTGPSLITMPWVLEQTFEAGGLDAHTELTLRRLDPFYRIDWEEDQRHLLFTQADRMPDQLAAFSARDAAAFPGFLQALKPIHEDGILAAGRRPFLRASDLARFTPRMIKLRAALSLNRFVESHFEHPRVREAMSFHSLFIGGDPFRVPAIYGALVYLQFLDGVWYADGGVYSIVKAMSRVLDVRYGDPVEQIETRGRRVTGVRTRAGEHFPADVVISNADTLSVHKLIGRPRPRRTLRPSMSCFLLYLGTNRRFEQLRHHHLLVGHDYRAFISDVTRRGRLPRSCSVYIHAPARTETTMAPPGGDSLCVLLPVPNLRSVDGAGTDYKQLRDWLLQHLEETYGLTGLRESIVFEQQMTPVDFQRRFGAQDGNAFGPEPTLQQSAYFRPHNRDDQIYGLYHVGAGTHPGAGIPGVLFGAEVTTGLIRDDAQASTHVPR